MAFQGFSPKLRLAMAMAKAKSKAKGETVLPIDQAEITRRNQVTNVRWEIRLAENLAQRAMIESRRSGLAPKH